MSSKRPFSVRTAVEDLFGHDPLPRDLALHLLTAWSSSLEVTERRIDRNLLLMAGLFVGFLLLDTGILAKVTFQGAELQRTGLVLSMVPAAMAFLYYRCVTLITFSHDLKTAIAVLYKKIHEPVYLGGLDLLTHTPSVRNLESYGSVFVGRELKALQKRVISIVRNVLSLGPLVAIVYTALRLWKYADVGVAIWAVAVLLSLLFVLRTPFYSFTRDHVDAFGERGSESPLVPKSGADARGQRVQAGKSAARR